MTAVKFRRTGKLLLIMSKVQFKKVDPKDILFSLPTITDDGPPPPAVGTTKLGADVLEIHEDDWRQIEWINASHLEIIAAEFELIWRILETQRLQGGFRDLHLRKAITSPLQGTQILSDTFRRAVPATATWLAGFGYPGVASIAACSFTLRLLSSIEIFGIAPDGIVERACFANTRVNNTAAADLRFLADFANSHDLLLVDWCSVALVEPAYNQYADYFTGRANPQLG